MYIHLCKYCFKKQVCKRVFELLFWGLFCWTILGYYFCDYFRTIFGTILGTFLGLFSDYFRDYFRNNFWNYFENYFRVILWTNFLKLFKPILTQQQELSSIDLVSTHLFKLGPIFFGLVLVISLFTKYKYFIWMSWFWLKFKLILTQIWFFFCRVDCKTNKLRLWSFHWYNSF